MNLGSRSLFLVVLLVVIMTAAYKYHQFMIKRDYLLIINIPCSSEGGKACFQADCLEGEEGCDISTYKKVEILANEAPQCLEKGTCESFSCPAQSSCSITYCSLEKIEEGERCSI